jgi:hypothetical protein
MNQNGITQSLIRQIVAHTRCAACGHSFNSKNVHVIGKRDNALAMSAVCRECRTQALFLVMLGQSKPQPIYTDLTPGEWHRFQARPAISHDDVIEFYRYMDSYAGDLSEVMDEPLPQE